MGKSLERIDTASKTVVQSTVSSGLHASATSVFWTDETGVYRIDGQSSSLVKISDNSEENAAFVDDGEWVQIDAGAVGFINSYNGTPRTVDAGRDLMGADDTNIYIEDPSSNAILQVPIDGSQGMDWGQARSWACGRSPGDRPSQRLSRVCRVDLAGRDVLAVRGELSAAVGRDGTVRRSAAPP